MFKSLKGKLELRSGVPPKISKFCMTSGICCSAKNIYIAVSFSDDVCAQEYVIGRANSSHENNF